MRVAAQPGLYDPSADVPTLAGSRCSSCGGTFFPPIAIGCEICGATEDSLSAIELAATGVVHSFATVHLHAGEMAAPFTIGEIQLAAGPLIRATLEGSATIGARVAAVWSITKVDGNGDDVVEPTFVEVRS